MAIYSKKSKDPTEVALSAIQDALNIRDADSKAAPGSTMGTASGPPLGLGLPPLGDPLDGVGEGRRRSPRSAANVDPLMETSLMPPGRDDRETVQAANDDRESIGRILQSLQNRPARTPYVIASLFAATWAISMLGLIYGFG